jgi:hypothetical protein
MEGRLLLYLYCNLFAFTIVIFKSVSAQGIDVGAADPLKFGQIDPLSLEIASTYVFIIPFVIFTVGILAIPASLVVVFLVLQPFIIPPEAVGTRRKRRKKRNIWNENRNESLIDSTMKFISKSDCLNQVICRMSDHHEEKSVN